MIGTLLDLAIIALLVGAVGFGAPDPEAVAKSHLNFSQFFGSALLDSEADMIELTGWWQGFQTAADSQLPMQALDGVVMEFVGDFLEDEYECMEEYE